jgi:hypothetical protein
MSKKGDTGQIERFEETARKLGADENEAAFKDKLSVIARHSRRTSRPCKRKDKAE